MNETDTYVIAASRLWDQAVFESIISKWPGRWVLAAGPAALTFDWLATIAPRRIFFLHWSWKVPADIVDSYECVGFHMTDLPYGRGGSPLQNLVVRGHSITKLSAFRLTEVMDAGPVYLKADLALNGPAHEIYARAAALSAMLIQQIVRDDLTPAPQVGTPVAFRRRRPEESEMPESAPARVLYDHIRMLDADGYPHAFIRRGDYRYEFTNAQLDGDVLTAFVRMRRHDDNDC